MPCEEMCVSDIECVICLDTSDVSPKSLNVPQTMALICGHTFHYRCLLKHICHILSKSPRPQTHVSPITCPLCRHNITLRQAKSILSQYFNALIVDCCKNKEHLITVENNIFVQTIKSNVLKVFGKKTDKSKYKHQLDEFKRHRIELESSIALQKQQLYTLHHYINLCKHYHSLL